MANRISTKLTWEKYADVFAMNLRRIRAERGYSQQRVASDAAISLPQYQRLESAGFRSTPSLNPKIRTLISLAEVLDVEVSDLLPKPWPDLREK
ncbi:helix-turn-helix transcriptional regulator [Bifidobacterium sp. ESL0769]|uniref:helix-turn-helix domain-containing protein n=1 Tax=Bifidobacterium sp. ESL0769 TaxID=2983229 RepID=UPI0023F90D3D|nr:helix-turn-helix transcriptional regulator [Bifidobacterium sp. ESL0769]WEV67261.1 helix-turn-helix transcriptional regulator [Bifidobacterium sp. ESL0769]